MNAQMGWFKRFASMSRGLKILTVLGVANNVGTGLAAPILLLFVHNVLKVDLASANMAVSITAIAALFAHFTAARLSRKINPLYICVGANALSALGALVYAYSTEFATVVPAALVTGCGLAASTGWFTVLGKVAADEEREFAFGVNQLSVNIGYSLGLALSSLAGVIGGSESYRYLFLGKMASHILLVVGLILLFSKTLSKEASDSNEINEERSTHSRLPGMFFLSFLYFGLVFAGFAQLDSAIPSGVIEYGEVSLGWSIASLMVIDTVGTSVFNLLFSSRLSMLKPTSLLMATCLSWIASWVVIWLALNLGPAFSVFLMPMGIYLFAFGEVPAAMAMPALTYQIIPEDAGGEAFGYQNIASSLAFIAAPVVTGVCINLANASASLIFYAAVLVVILAVASPYVEKLKLETR